MDQTCPVVHKSRRPQARLKTVTLFYIHCALATILLTASLIPIYHLTVQWVESKFSRNFFLGFFFVPNRFVVCLQTFGGGLGPLVGEVIENEQTVVNPKVMILGFFGSI
jgi:hypothetical protein